MIQEIFRRIGTTNRTFVEFGVGDGLENNSLFLLKQGARLTPRIPPNFAEAVDIYVEDLLATRWPRHPRLTAKLTKRRLETLLDVFG